MCQAWRMPGMGDSRHGWASKVINVAKKIVLCDMRERSFVIAVAKSASLTCEKMLCATMKSYAGTASVPMGGRNS